jgi:biotin synthase
MGETPTDRVDAAVELQDVGVSSLPVNILNPVAGTPMGDQEHADISRAEVMKTIAVYRFLHPDSRVRLTGGREVNLAPDEQHLPFEAGADGILTGDYLTTEGQSPGDDIEIMERAGLAPNRDVNDFDPAEVKDRHCDPDPDPDTAVGTATSNATTELDD